MKNDRSNRKDQINLTLSRLSARHISLIAILSLASLLFASYSVVLPPPAQAVSFTIVISQVYGGAGCGTAGCSTYQNDFIELFNRSNTPISVNGWSVQYASATGTAWQVTALPNVTIQPGKYLLVAESFGANGVNALPTPDVTGTIAMSATAAKVALVSTTTPLSGTCPTGGNIIDLVGYGATASCFEGTGPAPAPSTTTADIRAGGGCIDTDNNATDFAAAAPTPRNSSTPANTCAPTRVDFNSFNATPSDGGVLLHWRTGFEVDNLGFNVYRERNGRRTRINPQIIAGSALMARATLRAGHSYAWLDKTDSGGDSQYWLEAIDLNGQREWHGPLAATRSNDESANPVRSREQSLMLSRVGTTDNPAQALLPTAPRERAASPSKPTAAALSLQATATAKSAVKLAVKREGWYRVSQDELIRAGFNANVDPRFIQLFVDGEQQPIAITGEADGKFDAGDRIEFYGLATDSTVTDARVYWVTAGDGPGKRIEEVKGRKGRAAAASFTYTVERKDRTVYFSSLNNSETENFFGPVIASEPVTQSLALHAIDRAAKTDAELEVILQGVTGAQHKVRVFFNDADFGEIGFYDRAQGSAKLRVPVASLREGDNTIKLVAQGGESDVSLLDRIRLTYQRGYRADNNLLRLTAKGKSRLTIDGFNTDQVRVLDVTSPNGVTAVKAQVVQQGDGYGVTFITPGAGQRLLLAVAENRYERPAAITADSPSNLRQPGIEADFVIIAHHDFIESIEPLKSLRQSQGLTVVVADVENVYDEFSFGQKTPQAIKDFLSYASASWRRAPRFALLFGDASLDPKNYLGHGDFDFVPTKIIDTTVLETASDDWLTDFDDDGLANIAMGRLPVRTLQEANRVVGKIISYDHSTPAEGILLVNDLRDGYDFQAQNPQVKALIPARLRVQEMHRSEINQPATKNALLESLNRGQKIVNYFGHGSLDQWSGDYLTSTDALGLTNRDSLAVFLTVTCLNGYFQDSAVESLAESLLKADHGGAVAVWASSGMCDATSQSAINLEMFRLLFGDSGAAQLTLGEAALRAKAVTSERDTRMTYILFGDPTTRLR
jgi:hypothetical protein